MSRARVLVCLWLSGTVLLNCSGPRPSGEEVHRADDSGSVQPKAVAPSPESVVVEVDSDFAQTTYSIAREDCDIRWIVYSSDANRGVIGHRSECRLPLAGQAPLLAALLEKLLERSPHPNGYHTLFWGRLHPDGKPNPEMAMRLMLSAKRSAAWDTARGAPRNGGINGFVRDVLNQASAYAELKDVFHKAGLDLRVSAVEKVLVLRAGELTFYDRFQGSEIQAADRLPFDCMAWFAITAADAQPRTGSR